MSFFTIDEAREYATQLTADAIGEINQIENSERLINLAKFLCNRSK